MQGPGILTISAQHPYIWSLDKDLFFPQESVTQNVIHLIIFLGFLKKLFIRIFSSRTTTTKVGYWKGTFG